MATVQADRLSAQKGNQSTETLFRADEVDHIRHLLMAPHQKAKSAGMSKARLQLKTLTAGLEATDLNHQVRRTRSKDLSGKAGMDIENQCEFG